jgi:hypothetical protein
VEERLLDFEGIDREQDESQGRTLARRSATSRPVSVTKKRWADLEDSDEEKGRVQHVASMQQSEARKLTWADLEDSEGEEVQKKSEFSSLAASSGEHSSSSRGAAALQKPALAPAIGSSQQWEEEPVLSSVPGTMRPQRKAGHNKARQNATSAAYNDEHWWSQQQWETNGSEWWTAKVAEQDWWASQRWKSSKATARSHQANRRSGTTAAKPQCQFFIGIEEDPKFKVTKKVLGHHGQHMKAIAARSGAKLRLRGRGSGFLEGVEQQESVDELMLCVSAPDAAGYAEAVRLLYELLEGVYKEYRAFCRKSGWAVPELEVRLHEGPRPGSR